MVRKQVYIERRQNRDLKRLAREKGQTEAQIIREAIDHLVQDSDRDKRRLRAWKEERTFIRDWMAQGPAPSSPRKWKREDLYDRPYPGRH